MARHVRTAARRSRRLRLLLLSLALSLAGSGALAAALVGVGTPANPRAQPGPTDRTAVDPVQLTDWVDVLAGLDTARSRAFRDGDPAALRQVYTAGSTALRADQRLLSRYAEQGLRVEQLRMDVVDLRLLDRTAGRAELRVRDRVRGGRVVDREGRATALPADDISDHSITLVRTPDGWRIGRLEAAG